MILQSLSPPFFDWLDGRLFVDFLMLLRFFTLPENKFENFIITFS